METISAKAQVLADSLPRLRALKNSLVVIKYGGSVIDETIYADSILTDVAFLRQIGVSVAMVHGGGKAISGKMREAGVVPKFVDGLRVTDKKTIKIVESVLQGTINPQIVKQLNAHGVHTSGLSGKKAFAAKRLVHEGTSGQKVDLGFVGDITSVQKKNVEALLKKGIVPVITPLALGSGNATLNINADVAAARLAGELKASSLLFLSDVNGLLEDPQHPDSTISRVSQTDIQGLIKTGVIQAGMLPKVDSALNALRKGVKRVKMLNGQMAHCILIDLMIDSRLGTEVVLATENQ
ncbi:MAG: acetylglutamate kinase [Verrucomicrobiae bacterium]|nr:acetylglutamate kinase [Verrucomicrobiae bacterium]